MKKARKNYSPQEKVAILRSHLVDRFPTAQICAQFQLQPAIFYRWMKQLFENGPMALKRRPTTGKRSDAIQDGGTGRQQKLRAFESREAELNWMISLAQGRLDKEQIKQVVSNSLNQEDIGKLLGCIRNAPLKYRNRAVAILAYYRLIRVAHIADFLRVTQSTVKPWLCQFAQRRSQVLLPRQSQYHKAKNTVYRNAVFEILHTGGI